LLKKLFGSGLLYKIIRRMQNLKLYRVFARLTMRRKPSYDVATVEDAAALSDFYEHDKMQNQEDPVTQYIRTIKALKDHGFILMAKIKGKIVGSLVVRMYPDNSNLYPDWWLFGLRVDSVYRGMGFAENLMKMALEKAASKGGTRANLTVSQSNLPAIALHGKMGFQQHSIPDLDAKLDKDFRETGRREIILSIELD